MNSSETLQITELAKNTKGRLDPTKVELEIKYLKHDIFFRPYFKLFGDDYLCHNDKENWGEILHHFDIRQNKYIAKY